MPLILALRRQKQLEVQREGVLGQSGLHRETLKTLKKPKQNKTKMLKMMIFSSSIIV